MRMFENYSCHIRSTKKEIATDYFLPLVVEVVILMLCILPFRILKSIGPMLQEPSFVGDELTKPTLGRLVFGAIALVLWFVFSYIASKEAEKGKDYIPSFLGFAAGILLWQAIGEISWHYSVGGINFVPFESITTFPIACLFIILMVYGKKHHSFDWGIWCMLISFAFNWMGHYIMLGLYPFVEGIIDEHIWHTRTALVSGIIGIIYSIIYLLFRVKTKRGRILASMITYISIGVISFGLMEG